MALVSIARPASSLYAPSRGHTCCCALTLVIYVCLEPTREVAPVLIGHLGMERQGTCCQVAVRGLARWVLSR